METLAVDPGTMEKLAAFKKSQGIGRRASGSSAFFAIAGRPLHEDVEKRLHKRLVAPQHLSYDHDEPSGAFEFLSDADFQKRFSVQGDLGLGAYGIVTQVAERATGMNYAMKRFAADSEDLEANTEREVSMQYMAGSDFIVGIYKTFTLENGDRVLLTELMRDGDLQSHILQNGGVDEGLSFRETFRQIVDSVAACHNNDVAHLDIKPENIWLRGQEVKLGDFGFSREASSKVPNPATGGTLAYVAPELLRNFVDPTAKTIPLDAKACDMWSLGVTLYRMLTNKSPWKYSLLFREEVIEFIRKIDEEGMIDVQIPWPADVDPDAARLVEKMLQPYPNARYTINEVARDRYLRPSVPSLWVPTPEAEPDKKRLPLARRLIWPRWGLSRVRRILSPFRNASKTSGEDS
jgi:serine/threonine protein kinase